MVDLFEDIYQHIESLDTSISVDVNELTELISKVLASVDIEEDVAKIIIKAFFQEVQNALIRGEKVSLKDIGHFYVNKKNVVYFKAVAKITKKLNENR